MLQVEHTTLTQIPHFFRTLKRNAKHGEAVRLFSGEMTAPNGQVVSFASGLALVTGLDQVVQGVAKYGRAAAHITTTVFLMDRLLHVADLQDLAKTLREEIEFNMAQDTHRNVVILLPATEQLIANY